MGTSHIAQNLEKLAMCCTSHDAGKIAISLTSLPKWRQEAAVINHSQWTVNQLHIQISKYIIDQHRMIVLLRRKII
jgi:hypothetical protein